MKALPPDKHITYQLQYRRCGKANCRRCKRGGKHGPYYYAYYRDAGRVKSIYVGKKLPL